MIFYRQAYGTCWASLRLPVCQLCGVGEEERRGQEGDKVKTKNKITISQDNCTNRNSHEEKNDNRTEICRVHQKQSNKMRQTKQYKTHKK